jgi:hypothetical protein
VNRAPAALAIATLSFATRTIGAEPCPPRAELSGDPVAIARVRDELARLGVAIGAADPACRAVRARVELDERGGIAVAIVDAGRRTEGRVVSDPALAAAWIDSWLRNDLDASWSTRASAPAAPAAAPVAEHPSAVRTVRSVFDRGAVAVGYEQAFTGDASAWYGGSVAGCAALGPICIGARVRYGHQASGQTSVLTDERSELAALATASMGFELGRMAIVPELGLGAGRLAAQRGVPCKCGPSDPNCAPGCIDADGNPTTATVLRAVASHQPRVAAALRIAIPLFEHVWLDAIASVTYVPFAHADPFVVDPEALPQGTDPALYTLPGEPVTSMQLGIGLRVGVP